MSILRATPSLLTTLVLVLAPLPFGSTHAWTVSALEVSLFVLLGMLIVCEGGASVVKRLSTLALPAGALGAYLCFQLVPLPAAVLELLSPTRAALYRDLLGDTQRWLPLSLDPHASLLALLRLAAYASVFVIVATTTSPRRGYLFYWALLAAAALTAAVAWLHLLRGWDASLLGWFPAEQTTAAGGRLSWPFVNCNHLAMAMNLAWPLALGAAISPSAFASLGAKRSPGAIRVAGAALLALLVATLVGSQSRGGMASAVAAPLAMSLAWPLRDRGASGARTAAAMLTAVVLAAGASWIVSDMIHRPATGTELIALDRGDASLRVRLVAVRQSFGVLWDFPWFGSGLGTWAEVFRMYQRYPLLAVDFSHAHNDYVQWVEETGVAGLGLLGALAVHYFASVLGPLPLGVRPSNPDRAGEPSAKHRVRKKPTNTLAVFRGFLRARGAGDRLSGDGSDYSDGLLEAAKRRAALFGALSAAALHSALDFGLRIPANALLFAAVLGLLWRETSERDDAAGEAAESSFSRRVLAAAAGVAGLALLVRLGTLEWRDARMLEAAAAIRPGDSDDWGVLERAAWSAAFGGQPDFRYALAAVEAAPIVSTAHRTLALSCHSAAMKELEHRRAIRCAPAFGWPRTEFARLLLQVGRREEAQAAVEQAVYADPNAWPADLFGYRDPQSGRRELLAAALRGLRRRVTESPELAALLKSREAQFKD